MIKKFNDFQNNNILDNEREAMERELRTRKVQRDNMKQELQINLDLIIREIMYSISNDEEYYLTIGKRKEQLEDTTETVFHIEFENERLGRVRIFKPKDTASKGHYEVNGEYYETLAKDIRDFYHTLNQEIQGNPIIVRTAVTEKYNKETMVDQYKIFENLQQAKKYLADNNIPESDPRFIKLRELLRNNLGYMGQFTEWMYRDRESFDRIEDTFSKLKNINNLDKKVEDFDKLEDLYDYLQKFESDRKVKQVVNSLPSNTKKYVDEKLINLLSLNSQYADEIKGFYKKKGGRYNEHSRYWDKPSKFETYNEWLYDITDTFIKNLGGEFNSENIKKKMEGLNVDVIEDRPDLLMLRVYDYAASKVLGSTHWCISTSESMWNHYVNDFTNQYFVWDFSKDRSDIQHMIGTTVSPGGKITSGHWADDSTIRDLNYIDLL